MLNKVMLIGRVGSEPDGKQISEKFYVAALSLATSEKFKKDGQTQETTEWHKVKFFNALAQNVVMKYVKKGDLIYVCGKIHYSKVEKDGKTTYFTEIIADELKMLSGKHDQGEQVGQQAEKTQGKINIPTQKVNIQNTESDDNLPF